jgi:hypothetical protein
MVKMTHAIRMELADAIRDRYAAAAPRPTTRAGRPSGNPFMKGYTVFNAEQCDGLPAHYYAKAQPPALTLPERIEAADTFYAATGVDIRHGGTRAYYAEGPDYGYTCTKAWLGGGHRQTTIPGSRADVRQPRHSNVPVDEAFGVAVSTEACVARNGARLRQAPAAVIA